LSQPVLECNNPWETTCVCGSHSAPCWPRPDTGCCDRLNPDNPTPGQTAQIERMLHVAVETIWRLSGKQFGGCPVTARPCRQKCSDRPTYGYWSNMMWLPILDNGSWFNERCDRCRKPSGCSCSELCEIVLPGPVSEIIRVKVDGGILDPSEYRVDNFRKLVRTSVTVSATAPTCWPTCQELAKPDTEVGTLSVTYRPGNPVPQGGLWAAGLLACELLKACDGNADCALPASAQRIARQGVTVELTPVLVGSGNFLTGVPEVDLWLESVNPYKAKAPSRVFSLDRPAPRVTSWPCS
jgi:hypothetical protein